MKKQIKKILPTLLSAILVLALFVSGVRLIEKSSRSESVSMVEQSVSRAALQCYALEGFYPRSLSYLEERYGVMVDMDVYFIHYQYIADNLAPEIYVTLRGAG